MKKTIIILIVLLSITSQNLFSQCGGNIIKTEKATSIGIIIYSNDTEAVWNAFRLANFSLNKGDTVSVFLLGKGVELEKLSKTNNDIKEQTDFFIKNNGVILGCGTCLQSRNNSEPQICKFSSMNDLYNIIRKNKIILTF